MQKQKKIQISEALPSVMTKTLGKYEIFAECRYYHTRRKATFEKKPNTVSKMFAECLAARHSAYYYHLPRAALGDKEF